MLRVRRQEQGGTKGYSKGMKAKAPEPSTRKVRSGAATNDKVVGGATGGQPNTTEDTDLSLYDMLSGDDHRATAGTTRKDSDDELIEEGMTEYGPADMALGFDELIAFGENDLGEYAIPIAHDDDYMLSELNKVQQEARRILLAEGPLTCIMNTLPSDSVF